MPLLLQFAPFLGKDKGACIANSSTANEMRYPSAAIRDYR
jgi:hypothetical protein